ncbi:MAG: TonB family protein [Bryobacterales bacterium]|nr:TonB family protein [Bryobacteraceae bacterium]MDW8353534.1 TonB family protein [Bryobacterales bacterium]
MEAVVRPREETVLELRFFPEWESRQESFARARLAGILSLVLHAAGIAALLSLPIGSFTPRQATQILAQLREPIKLVAPPKELTQTAPNRGRVGKEFQLEDLLPRPRLFQPPSPSTTRPAAPVPAPVALPEPPRLELPQVGLGDLPLVAQGAKPLPPPQIQPEEKPKLAFETPGSPRGAPQGVSPLGSLRPPGSSVAELGRELARGGLGGGLVVGDLGEGVGGLGEMLNLPPSPGYAGSALELLSDPQGVDFRPYLIQILSAVRRNWYAVMPESAKLGRRGRTVIQFAINRDGTVPKLVIAVPSGTEALDRAAVAGISASHPFPPLPREYQGQQIRLQFVFLYNMRSR